MYPGGSKASGLNVAPAPEASCRTPKGAARGGGKHLTAIEGAARVVLALLAVTALPDPLEGISHGDRTPVIAAKGNKGLYKAAVRPDDVCPRGASEFADGENCARGVGHGRGERTVISFDSVGGVVVYQNGSHLRSSKRTVYLYFMPQKRILLFFFLTYSLDYCKIYSGILYIAKVYFYEMQQLQKRIE